MRILVIILVLISISQLIKAQATSEKEEVVKLNGREQTIIIQTRDTSNSILLILHGYTTPTSIFSEFFTTEGTSRLLDNFNIIHWDQRGTGLSFSKDIKPKEMTQEQIMEDANELVEHLKERFNKEKIYLYAQSWGTIIGMRLIHKYPQNFHSYIGEAQASNYKKSVIEMQEYAMRKATNEDNKKAIHELKRLPELSDSLKTKEIKNYIKVSKKWATHYVMMEYDGTDIKPIFIKALKNSAHYDNFHKKVKLLQSIKFTKENTIKELMHTDLKLSIDTVEIPIYFFVGYYDYLYTEAQAFFETIKAPHKEFITFYKSGHIPSIEETDKFVSLLLYYFNKGN